MRWLSTDNLAIVVLTVLMLCACRSTRRLDMQEIRAASLGWQLQQASFRNIDVLIDDTTWSPMGDTLPKTHRRRIQATAVAQERQQLEQTTRDTSEVHAQKQATEAVSLPHNSNFFTLFFLIVIVFIGFLVRRFRL